MKTEYSQVIQKKTPNRTMIQSTSRLNTTPYVRIEDYFKSNYHKIAFMLLYYHPMYNKELNITKDLYNNEKAAKAWRDQFFVLFHPNRGVIVPRQNEVLERVDKIYRNMVQKNL